MVVPLFPRLAGFKIEDVWKRTPHGQFRCTARLSRPLLPKESERIENLLKTRVHGVEVVHECGREELEEWKSALIDALRGVPRPAQRRAVAIGGRGRRSPGVRRGPDRPEPAA